MNDPAKQLAQLSPAKRALLQKLLQQQIAQKTGEQTTTLRRRTQQQDLPLSSNQQRLWFLDQFEEGSAAYNIAAANKVSGLLVMPALARSLRAIMQRHEILRTAFRLQNEQPVQRIQVAVAFHMPVVDLSALTSEWQQSEIARLAQHEAQCPFDLMHAPLFRVTVLRLRPTEHVLFTTFHHSVFDGWSTGIFIRELSTLYTAYVQGQTASLPELPLQYADYALWQQEWLQGAEQEHVYAYWAKQLEGETALQLPTDHLRPAVPTYRGAQKTFGISSALTSGIRALSHDEGVTLFMALLALFQVLLSRYTGQTDIAVGTTIANRTRSEFEEVIGFFANTLVLRADLGANPTFRQVLGRIRSVAMDAFAHEALPFEVLVARLRPERHLSRSPLVQVMFNLFNAPTSKPRLADITLTPVPFASRTAKFDLTLDITEVGQELRASLEYSLDLFESSTIEWMASAFISLLEQAIAHPEKAISELELLREQQRHILIHHWNATQNVIAPARDSLPQLFEAQVERTPDAVAVVFEDHVLTYSVLNRLANQLAHRLLMLGVQPGTKIGFCLERSLELVFGVLGILKAGGTYVPLDPAYPAERLIFMLEGAHIAYLLTQRHLYHSEWRHIPHAIALDSERVALSREPSTNPPLRGGLEQAVYVIFTSGSTGQPKGAAVYQRGFANLLNWYTSEFHMTGQDRVLLVTSLSFDLTQKNIFAPLLTGGALHLLATRYHDVLLLRQSIQERAITLLNCTPSMFYPFIDGGEFAGLTTLRHVFLGGEPIAVARLQAWLAHESCHAQVVNTYGPTECSDVVAYYRISQLERFQDTPVPIGRPIAHTQLFVLDERRQLVPLSVPGELYIAGECLGAGYINDTSLTAERFLPHPFADGPGGRLYKTGDLARYRADGCIEYIGRTDYQVKIRGFRIELSEIEAVLTQHPDVSECVVLTWERRPDDKRLVAYIVGGRNGVLRKNELRQYVRSRLPEYMVPTSFVILETLPLTPGGKVNRRALPVPQEDEQVQASQSLPRTPIEEVIAGIFREVLNREQVSTQQNFFDLGGHSLLATRVIARVRAQVRVDMPLRVLFEAPTVAEFAQSVEQRLRKQQHSAAVPTIVAVRRDQQLPLSFAQQRMWFLSQLSANASVYALPVNVTLRGELRMELLERCIQRIVQRHECLRTTFPLEHPVQIIHARMDVGLTMIDVSRLEEAERLRRTQSMIMASMAQPFDVQHGPLLRVGVTRLAQDEHIFSVVFHHIVFDGWSVGVFLQELVSLYNAFIQEKPDPFPSLPIQYVDFAVWQRNELQGSILADLIAYWTQQLRGASAILLPAVRSESEPASNRGAAYLFSIPSQVTEALKVFSRRQQVTLFMTLLTAFQVFLYRVTGQQDVVIGTDIANRMHEETEKLIGFFVNLLVLRMQFDAGELFQDALQRASGMVLEAYAHQDLPFEKIIEVLQLERKGHQTPLVNVLFVWQNTPEPSLEFHGIEAKPLENEVQAAKFDLAVFMAEREEELVGFVNYRTDLFNASKIEHLMNQFLLIVQQIITVPDSPLGMLDIETQAEKEQRAQAEAQQQESQRRKLKGARRSVITFPTTNISESI
ncbi:non-ribosomal peptide synthetase [Ktedonobacter robiniae]|uniref:Carrier domain-containing protein n=1 Tax=Ktedonobacter robiniae TaxID=2778365 RepID=A0ABQ3V6U3_9CHLR|nr:non-ribosomal peptide synthetase [Ktedonobacter robiniae]GHO60130.1 hypothetical protein KSB_86050 [Ktedonobacter robiniae]